ncbi:hypothetical protein [Natrinema sp. SYSU A 869]|uniref:hypothetical protein n=1 Tax=Natrinema sp. SYSU A 869 TaxID=2871694 RepID=UPI001CA3AAD3|nr:hypothetical protein [Natrinema sp. SYSU A 869]
MTGHRGGHRRQFLAGLAAIGGATVAGCNGMPWSDDTGSTFTAADAAAVVTDSSPPIEWPVPVVPAASAVDEGLERVDTLLADVPDPLDAETVPNGVVREAIRDGRNSARKHRAEAAAATGDELYHALHTTRDARENARVATTTFAAIDDEALVEPILDERYRDRLDEPADMSSVFDAALEASIDRVDVADLPAQRNDRDWLDGVDSDLDDHLERVLWRIVDPVLSARNGLREAIEDGRLGIGLHEAVRFEQRYRALERVRDGIEDGTVSVPDTVDEIRAERTAAIDAAASVRESLPYSSLGTYVLAETLRSLEWTDEQIRRAADNDADTAVSLGDEYGEYVRLRSQFEVLLDAVTAFRKRLQSA